MNLLEGYYGGSQWVNSLQNLVNIREEANRPILAPRIRRGGGGKHTLFPLQKEDALFPHQKAMFEN